MNRLELLEKEVQALSREELSEFERWFAEYKADLWDKQIEEDVKAGRLDKIANRAIDEIRKGNYREL